MTYKDDLDKLRKEARIDVDDFSNATPEKASAKSSSKYPLPSKDSSPKAPADEGKAPAPQESLTFTQEEKKMTWWQKISLPFIRNSFLSVLFFVLITLIWIAISHTVLGSIRNVDRRTQVLFMIKDGIFMIILATVMYRLFLTQFANTYHLEEDYKKAQEEIKMWQSIQRSQMETIPETLAYTLDRDFRYTSFNTRHKYSMLRMWHSEIKIGDCLLDHITDDGIREIIRKDLEQTLKGEYTSQTSKFGDNDQTAIFWQHYYAPVLDEKKNIIGISCYVNNITALKQSQNKNLFLSVNDPLTQLYNRIHVEGAFAKAEREEIAPYSIIVIDIQGMHQVNENYGTKTGDNLLIKVGEVLQKAVKDSGDVARWGSDEFLILLPGTDAATAEALANICKCDFSGVTVNGVPLRAHFGYATRTDMSRTLTDVLRSAEVQSMQSRA
ncbi:MAG: GGDEF domain-containing protein [Clostridiales bacterium]|nr:GGDEF domain-containing protein [Clostridiales bacterium]